MPDEKTEPKSTAIFNYTVVENDIYIAQTDKGKLVIGQGTKPVIEIWPDDFNIALRRMGVSVLSHQKPKIVQMVDVPGVGLMVLLSDGTIWGGSARMDGSWLPMPMKGLPV